MPVLFRPETDIFRVSPFVDIMVNPVNCVGTMGAGLAKEFKTRYPEMFERYHELCTENKIQIGVIQTYERRENRNIIINLPTKTHYGDDSDVEYIRKGLMSFRRYLEKPGRENLTVGMPMLGCGLGNLEQDSVKPVFMECLGDLPNIVLVTQRPEVFKAHPKVLVIFGSRLFAARTIEKKPNSSYDAQCRYMETSIQKSLKEWGLDWKDFDAVVSGGAGGVDEQACGLTINDPSYKESIAYRHCHDIDTQVVIARADWERFKKSAGFVRNQFMADLGTHFIGFRPENITSPGTDGMIKLLMTSNEKLKAREPEGFADSRFFKNIKIWGDDLAPPMSTQMML